MRVASRLWLPLSRVTVRPRWRIPGASEELIRNLVGLETTKTTTVLFFQSDVIVVGVANRNCCRRFSVSPATRTVEDGDKNGFSVGNRLNLPVPPPNDSF